VDPLGFTSNLLRGSTVFTGLIALSLIFITMMGYTASGESPKERRPPILLITIMVGVGFVSVTAYLFPDVARAVAGLFDRLPAK
jgi:hypothetical protein